MHYFFRSSYIEENLCIYDEQPNWPIEWGYSKTKAIAKSDSSYAIEHSKIELSCFVLPIFMQMIYGLNTEVGVLEKQFVICLLLKLYIYIYNFFNIG